MRNSKTKATRNRQRTATAIDMGTHAIKLATVSRDETGVYTLDRWTSVTVEAGATDSAACARALETALARHGSPEGVVATMIPRQRAVIRYVTLPSVVKEEIDDIMDLEVERHSPIPSDEMEMGFEVVAERGGNESDVLMAAAARGDLLRHLELLRACNVEPDVIEVAGMNVARAFLDQRSVGDTIAVVDVGRTQTTVSVWRQGFTRFSRSVAWGAERLQTFLQGGEAPVSLAELNGDAGALQAHPGWELWSRRLEMELRRTFTAFEHDKGGAPIRRVHLTGGLGSINAVVEALKQRLPYDLDAICPLGREIKLAKGVSDPPPALADCIGAAIRVAEVGESGVNLLPSTIVAERQRERSRSWLRNSSLLALGVVMLLAGSVYLQWLQRNNRINELNVEINILAPQVRKVSTQEQKMQSLNANIDYNHSAFKVLHDIYMAMPDNSNIARFSYTKQNEIVLVGDVFEDNDVLEVGDILRGLNSSWPPHEPHFKNVEAGPIKRKPIAGTGIIAREYQFTCELSSKPERQVRRGVRR